VITARQFLPFLFDLEHDFSFSIRPLASSFQFSSKVHIVHPSSFILSLLHTVLFTLRRYSQSASVFLLFFVLGSASVLFYCSSLWVLLYPSMLVLSVIRCHTLPFFLLLFHTHSFLPPLR
jgi:hypothetical protein